MTKVVINTKVKNSIRDLAMIQDKALKPLVGKTVTVTIDTDEGTEVTTLRPDVK